MDREITLSEKQWKQIREWVKSFFKRTEEQKEKTIQRRFDKLLR